ncbi:MAG: hypothetical protein V4675_06290 [Verrucomicrobiota bacterium]
MTLHFPPTRVPTARNGGDNEAVFKSMVAALTGWTRSLPPPRR